MTEAFLVVLNINIFLCHSEFLSDSLQQDADVFVFLRDCKRDAFNFFKSVQRVLYKIRQQPLALVHADIRKVCCTPANHIHAFLKCKQGFFFEIHHHADGHFNFPIAKRTLPDPFHADTVPYRRHPSCLSSVSPGLFIIVHHQRNLIVLFFNSGIHRLRFLCFFIIITDLTHLCIDVISYNTSMCHEVFPPLVSNKNILSKLFFCCKFLHRDCQCFILQ